MITKIKHFETIIVPETQYSLIPAISQQENVETNDSFLFQGQGTTNSILNFINASIRFAKEVTDKELPFVDILINPFLANVSILYALQTPENQRFSVVFKGF